MGFSFNFFGEQRHREFNYKPRYYDVEEEERRRLFGKVDGSAGRGDAGDKPAEYHPGQYVQGAFRDGNYQKDKSVRGGSLHRIIGIITLVLVFAVLYFFAKFYMLILE